MAELLAMPELVLSLHVADVEHCLLKHTPLDQGLLKRVLQVLLFFEDPGEYLLHFWYLRKLLPFHNYKINDKLNLTQIFFKSNLSGQKLTEQLNCRRVKIC